MSEPFAENPTRVVIVMGVSGSGKTTLGRALAPALAARTGRGWTFADADDFHSPQALATMGRGQALTDADRAPWLARLGALVETRMSNGPPSCSRARRCKADYRTTLHADHPGVATLWLDAPAGVLAARLDARLGAGRNPVGPSLLPSQLATLEPPSRGAAAGRDAPARGARRRRCGARGRGEPCGWCAPRRTEARTHDTKTPASGAPRRQKRA